MACDVPVVPPSLEQARLICSESKPTTPEAQAALAGCQEVWEKYNAIRGPYDKCRQAEGLARTKALLDAAAKGQ